MKFFEKFHYQSVENVNEQQRRQKVSWAKIVLWIVLTVLLLVALVLSIYFVLKFFVPKRSKLQTADSSNDQLKNQNCTGELIPGIGRIQVGIDITTLNLFPSKKQLQLLDSNGFKKRLFEFTCNQNKTWAYPFNLGQQYTVPDQIESVNSIPSEGLNVQTRIYRILINYKKYFTNLVGLDEETNELEGAFSNSLGYKEMQKQILKSNKSVVELFAQVSTIQVNFQKNTLSLKVNQEFIDYVQHKLILHTYEQNPRMYDEFVDTFGTHYFESATIGGYLNQKSLIDNDYLYETNETEINENLRELFFGQINFPSSGNDSNVNVTSNSFDYYGIDVDIDYLRNNQLRDDAHWWKIVKKDPWLLSGQLRPIEQLILNETIRQEVAKAVASKLAKSYLENIQNAVEITNVQLDKSLTDILNKTQQLLTTQSKPFDLIEYRKIKPDINRLFEIVQQTREKELLKEYSDKLSQLKSMLFCKVSLIEICNDKLFPLIDVQLNEYHLLKSKFQNLLSSNQLFGHNVSSELIRQTNRLVAYHTEIKIDICQSDSKCKSCLATKLGKIDYCKDPKAMSVVQQ